MTTRRLTPEQLARRDALDDALLAANSAVTRAQIAAAIATEDRKDFHREMRKAHAMTSGERINEDGTITAVPPKADP